MAPGPQIAAGEPPDPFPGLNLLDRLLEDQRKLRTPVAEFARKHGAGDLAARTGLYRHLIPLEKPAPGHQYAFQVALDRCTGCKACVSACHSLNGLDDDEAWRVVGTLVADDDTPGWEQTVTSACHHCLDPQCLSGCPVAAYVKDPQTGIVRHLDDQCIGCEYCVMKCSYEVPKYSRKRGIVRKCDMCHQRLEVGEAPACVQACPTEAIRIVTVATEAIAAETASGEADMPGLPDPRITVPTTRFVGREIPTSAHDAGQSALIPESAHWPLVVMLVFTQAGMGFFSAGAGLGFLPAVLVGAALFFGGLGASVLHLGRPMGAWRFFLGLRTSWLSREILAFGLTAGAISLALASFLVPTLPWHQLGTLGAMIFGWIGVFTSIMVYHDTGRAGWRLPRTAVRFLSTGAVALLAGCAMSGTLSPWWMSIALLAKLGIESLDLRHASGGPWSSLAHSARVQLGPLRSSLAARFLTGLGAVCLGPIWLPGGIVLLLAGELLERSLFFRSIHSPRMPRHAAPLPH